MSLETNPQFIGAADLLQHVQWEDAQPWSKVVPVGDKQEIAFDCVAEVSRYGYFLKADGGYTFSYSNTGSWKPRGPEKAKANAILAKPQHEAFEPHWANVVRNLKALETARRHPGFEIKAAIVENDLSLKIRHILFVVS